LYFKKSFLGVYHQMHETLRTLSFIAIKIKKYFFLPKKTQFKFYGYFSPY